ncbi:MAG: glycosyltransferase [Gemmatimonadales bacterium]|nr:glycosyltransferase [Gemmatimonadales bacterium]
MIPKICFLSAVHRYDDVRILHKEGRSLAAAGFHVVHLSPAQSPQAPFVEDGVRIRQYQQQRGLIGRMRNSMALYRLARDERADAYHCNEPESWIVGAVVKFFANWPTKLVFDVHEHYPSRFDEPRSPWILRRFGSRLVQTLYAILTPSTDQLIFAKRSVALDFRGALCPQEFIFNLGPLWLQHKTIDSVPPRIRELFDGRPTAMHIGSLSRITGWPQLLRAMARMNHSEMQLLCVGTILEGADTVMAEARELGVDDRIKLIERVPYETVFDYLLCARLGLMLYQPGIQNHVFAFPMKLYDYMSMGVPVIAPRFAVEVAPIVIEASCGILIDTDSVEQLAEALDQLCGHPEQAAAMGRNGREAIRAKYNWEAEAPKLRRIYSRLIGQPAVTRLTAS